MWQSLVPIAIASLLLGGCVTKDYRPTVTGYVAADEPRAAQIGQQVMANGGNALDAATAMGLALSVTLPSRVGLAGGGVCLVHDPKTRRVVTLDFVARPASPGGVPLPALARGLYALEALGGRLRWEKLAVTAETLARQGVPVSRALAQDLVAAAPALARDPAARRLFLTPAGQPLAEGTTLVQAELGEVLGLLRDQGPSGFYGDALGPRLGTALGLAPTALRSVQVAVREPVTVELGRTSVVFPALPERSSAPEPALWQALSREGASVPPRLALAAGPGPAPAGASVVALDPFDQAVACTFSLGGLFGNGRVAPGLGLVEASASAAAGVGEPILVVNPIVYMGLLAGAATPSGAAGSDPAQPLATALTAAYQAHEQEQTASAVVHPGSRLNLVACHYSQMTGDKTCQVATDPAAAGLALEAQSPSH